MSLAELSVEPDAPRASSCALHRFDASDEPVFRKNFNRLPFQYAHRFHESDLFGLDRIAELGEFMAANPNKMNPSGNVTIFDDDAELAQGWNRRDAQGVRVGDVLEKISTSHSWVLLRGIQAHPEYAPLMDQFFEDLSAQVGQDIRSEVTWCDLYLFVSSPGMVTGYHIDHESNFLMQIKGAKTLCLVDPADRDIIKEEEIEQYFVGNLMAAKYSDAAQDHAYKFALEPGIGVHHPPLAPHWAVTGPDYSISLSVPFCMKSLDKNAKVYQANYYLRRLGMRPKPPGRSGLGDWTKKSVMTDLWHRPKIKSDVTMFGLEKYRNPLKALKSLVG